MRLFKTTVPRKKSWYSRFLCQMLNWEHSIQLLLSKTHMSTIRCILRFACFLNEAGDFPQSMILFIRTSSEQQHLVAIKQKREPGELCSDMNHSSAKTIISATGPSSRTLTDQCKCLLMSVLLTPESTARGIITWCLTETSRRCLHILQNMNTSSSLPKVIIFLFYTSTVSNVNVSWGARRRQRANT